MTSEPDEVQLTNQEPFEGNGTPNYDHLPPDEHIAALSSDLGEALKDANHNKDTAQRAQAELANLKKRADEERISLQQYSNSRLIIKLLPVFDELDLAVGHADQAAANDPWVEGVRLIQRKVSHLLETEGVSKIEALGVQFDPLEHEAVGTEETTQCPSGHVVEVVRNGYRLHDRVIQPAQVVVAR